MGGIAPAFAGGGENAGQGGKDDATASPIKHVIIIIGENRSFDHVFATYKPVNKQERILNLLSQGIVLDDGSPGPNYGAALQYNAHDHETYKLTPPKSPYATLPPALVGGTSTPYACQFLGFTTGTSCVSAANIEAVKQYENGLAEDYYQYLLTGGTEQTNKTPDIRVHYDGQDATHLPPGPYQLTNSINPAYPYPYDAYAASPVHRFFQMQQQLDCDAAAADKKNGWGCSSDLYPWVEETVGAGSNGAAPPSPFTAESDRRGLDGDGLLQCSKWRRALPEIARRRLFDERQLSPRDKGRHGRKSHCNGRGGCDLFFQWLRDHLKSRRIAPSNPANPTVPLAGQSQFAQRNRES